MITLEGVYCIISIFVSEVEIKMNCIREHQNHVKVTLLARFSRKCMKRECLLLPTGRMLIPPLQERSKSILSLVK